MNDAVRVSESSRISESLRVSESARVSESLRASEAVRVSAASYPSVSSGLVGEVPPLHEYQHETDRSVLFEPKYCLYGSAL